MKSFLKSLVVSILTFEAKLLLSRAKPRIIAVTGNVGKTGTKDAIFQALRSHVSARKSEKSYNSEIGVPLSILGLENAWSNPLLWTKNIFDGMVLALFPKKYPSVLVLEAGVDRPGDMQRLTSWLYPDIVVLTRLPDVPVHVEHFTSPEEVIAEKLILLRALKPNGVLVYNQDDERVKDAAASFAQKSVSYSRYSESDFTASGDTVTYEDGLPLGLKFTITNREESADFNIKGALGVQYTYNFAAATAVASLFDVSLAESANALRDFAAPAGRMRLIKGIKDTLIIDDTYNSSPTATERALSTLAELRGAGRKLAVLGDMLELGRYSVEAHKKVGQQVSETADLLVTVGVRARGIAEGALAAGMSEKNILQYEESIRAGRELQNLVSPGDAILVKGSQGMRMERIVADLMREPDRAEELLVRQSTVWQRIS